MDEVQKVLDGLKDFQKKSVNHAYDLFYNKSKNRLLIADEVGLGKTLIAKGIIAKAYEKYQKEGKPFHVVYICSNQALASQNLKKLNFLGENQHNIGRLLFLALKKDDSNRLEFRLSSLTPNTSFELRKGSGLVDERAIIYTLLSHYEVFKNKKGQHKRKLGLNRLLRENVKDANWKKKLQDRGFKISPELEKKFRAELLGIKISGTEFPSAFDYLRIRQIETKIPLWEALYRIAQKVGNEATFPKTSPIAREMIGALRKVLTSLTVKNLDADLFILDEFQRFKDLIDVENESDAGLIARAAFSSNNAKVLMLSATPFKPYTDRFDELEGEEHYEELKKILKFLQEEKDTDYWDNFELDRKAFFELMQYPQNAVQDMTKAVETKRKLESHYRQVMSRNERSVVVEDGKSMVADSKTNIIKVLPNDIKDFIKLDKVVKALNQHILNARYKLSSPVEFSKSVPFPLSFSENYKLNSEMKDKGVKLPKAGFLEQRIIKYYHPIPYPNGKIRKLIDEAMVPGANMLWIPPSLPYYQPFGAYKVSQDYSKTLVFSGWAMVPRAIATILSYETERMTIGQEDISMLKGKNSRTYFEKRRVPRPQLVFGNDEGKPRNMTNYCLLYPSFVLSDVVGLKDYKFDQTHEELIEIVTHRVEKKLNALKKYEKGEIVDPQWYWVAAILLDKEDNSDFYIEDSLHYKENNIHIKKIVSSWKEPNFGRMPEDLSKVLAKMALGSPSIASLRALQKLFPHETPGDLFDSAQDIAGGFFSLFNKPESISIVRMSTEKLGQKGYWHKVLSYCISGNIQAMMDEYAYMLNDGGASRTELAEQIASVLSIRSAAISVETESSIKKKGGNKMKMRTHFAMSFGTQSVKSESGSLRMVNVREAFNAPFRPFVLASTSIGQEGLDFHYYCRKIVHWNLPSNAIDIEQREGRINRYKGLVIRKNIADKFRSLDFDDNESTWHQLFAQAEKEVKGTKKNDMIPFWHINSDSGSKIERSVPMHPFSKDIRKYEKLKKVLAVYRLTFGQPRQEELVKILSESLSPEQTKEFMNKLIIDLSPK